MPLRRLVHAVLFACLPLAAAGPDAPSGSATLKEKHAQLRAKLERNAFGRPLHLDSAEASGAMRGDVHAVLEHPFRRVAEGLATASQWCQVLTLPFNVQRCESDGGQALALSIGRTPQSPLEEATRIGFRYSVPARSADYLQVRLAAPAGPLGTSDYLITFAATALDERRTLVHMHYGYRHGAMSKMAMQAYLSTSGAGKVGFTANGMRGVMERNTMRYFLAIDAYLDSLAAPRDRRLRARLDKWFGATERYAKQLREMSREEYLALKSENKRGQTPIS
jgi:hypothetical protein